VPETSISPGPVQGLSPTQFLLFARARLARWQGAGQGDSALSSKHGISERTGAQAANRRAATRDRPPATARNIRSRRWPVRGARAIRSRKERRPAVGARGTARIDDAAGSPREEAQPRARRQGGRQRRRPRGRRGGRRRNSGLRLRKRERRRRSTRGHVRESRTATLRRLQNEPR